MKRLSAKTYAELYYRSAASVTPGKRAAVAKNFLQLLRRHRAQKLLPRIMAHLGIIDDREHQRTRITMTAPNKQHHAAIETQLTKLFGSVAIDLTVDPAMFGGLVLRVGDDEIDGSLRTRIRRLHHHLTND